MNASPAIWICPRREYLTAPVAVDHKGWSSHVRPKCELGESVKCRSKNCSGSGICAHRVFTVSGPGSQEQEVRVDRERLHDAFDSGYFLDSAGALSSTRTFHRSSAPVSTAMYSIWASSE